MFTASLKTLPEGPGDPEQGMQTEEQEGADQQPGHAPEGIEQIRILVPIMMGRMGKVSGKFPVGIRMTGPAGLNHIITMQRRL